MLKLRDLFLLWAFCISSVSACTFVNLITDYQNNDKVCSLKPNENYPIVLVALLVRNKEHVLPHVLTYFENQTYPKKRMILWIRSDHNRDKSGEILKLWINHTSALYHSVDFLDNDRVKRYRGEPVLKYWTVEHRHFHMSLKENALNYARKIGADYVFFLDADVLLTNERTIEHLVSLRLPIVAPKLKSTRELIHFTTCRSSMSKPSPTLVDVAAVSQAFLINLHYPGAQNLTFDMKRFYELGEHCFKYQPRYVDQLILAASAKCSHILTFLCHQHHWGHMMQSQTFYDTWAEELLELIDIRLDILIQIGVIAQVPEYLNRYVYTSKRIFKIVFESLKPAVYGVYANEFGSKMGFDEIYMINLDRRPERRALMENLFKVLDLEVTRFPAIDVQSMDILKEYNITIYPEFESPFRKKDIKLGEIGCFLSHYEIWKRMVARKQQLVLVFEDDLYFGPCFKTRVIQILESAKAMANYDLLYLARLKKFAEDEPWFQPKNGVKYADYSYVTYCYVLTLQGAEKLLAAKPLEKLMPVDEFLPIMYGAGRNKTRISYFPVRNLIALAAEVDLVWSLAYDQQKSLGYISDTKVSPSVA